MKKIKKFFKKIGWILTVLFIRPFWFLYNIINKKYCNGFINFMVISGGTTKDITIWAYGEKYTLSRDSAKELFSALEKHLKE
jgi:hypothetical protein